MLGTKVFVRHVFQPHLKAKVFLPVPKKLHLKSLYSEGVEMRLSFKWEYLCTLSDKPLH